jgi:hypothetical protein
MFCPACNIDLGPPLNDLVTEGDLSFCPNCGAMMIVDSDFEMRLPTEEEEERARRDPEVRLIEFVIKTSARVRHRQNN